MLRKLREGIDVILEIEMQGAMQVKQAYPDARLIFVLPPSLEVLRNRLISRGTEDEDQLRRRMCAAMEEIRKIEDYEYFVVNGDLASAVDAVRAIIRSGRQEVDGACCEAIIRKYEEEE